MNERNAALGAFGVASGPVLLDAIESLPLGDGDRSLEVRFGLLSRLQKSVTRSFGKNLRQNKTLSGRSVGLPTQACLASWVLARHGLEVTPDSRLLLLRQVAEAALDAGWAMERAAQGDHAPATRRVDSRRLQQHPRRPALRSRHSLSIGTPRPSLLRARWQLGSLSSFRSAHMCRTRASRG